MSETERERERTGASICAEIELSRYDYIGRIIENTSPRTSDSLRERDYSAKQLPHRKHTQLDAGGDLYARRVSPEISLINHFRMLCVFLNRHKPLIFPRIYVFFFKRHECIISDAAYRRANTLVEKY